MVPSTISFTGAAAAYDRARAALAADGGSAVNHAVGEEAPPTGFAALVRNALSGAVASGRAAESLSLDAVADRADLTQVVTAVAEAETVLNTVVAVRDRVIEAYKDIMRMPI